LINARYSVPTWLWASSSFISGLVVIFSFAQPSIATFVDAVAFGVTWGPMVGIFGLIAMYGMATKNETLVRIGAFASFCLWVAGAVALFITGAGVAVFYFVGQLVLFWAYKYLASFVRYDHRL
jgi:hypothetical protein